MPRDVALLIIGLGVGSVVGWVANWLVGRSFYRRQIADQTASQADLHQQLGILATLMEQQGIARTTRNDRGDVTGVIVSLRATIGEGEDISAILRPYPGPPRDEGKDEE